MVNEEKESRELLINGSRDRVIPGREAAARIFVVMTCHAIRRRTVLVAGSLIDVGASVRALHSEIQSHTQHLYPLLIYHACSPQSTSTSAIESHLRSLSVVVPQWRHTTYSTSHFPRGIMHRCRSCHSVLRWEG